MDVSVDRIGRVLKPGGVVLFTEPLDHNPAIEFYRKRTPEAHTPDEHPLLVCDFQKFDAAFELTDVRLCGLTSLGSVLFRRTLLLGLVRGLGSAMDAALLRVPGLKWWAFYASM
jgi:SAM-dependent methyltransferase